MLEKKSEDYPKSSKRGDAMSWMEEFENFILSKEGDEMQSGIMSSDSTEGHPEYLI